MSSESMFSRQDELERFVRVPPIKTAFVSWQLGAGVGGGIIVAITIVRFSLPTVRRIVLAYRSIDEEDEAHARDRHRIDADLVADQAKFLERMNDRARERPQDKVQLFDGRHAPLGWGLRRGSDSLGRPVIWVRPALYGAAALAEDASGPIVNARFDDGGIEGPWDEEISKAGREKLPSEPGWAAQPEREEHGRWSNER